MAMFINLQQKCFVLFQTSHNQAGEMNGKVRYAQNTSYTIVIEILLTLIHIHASLSLKFWLSVPLMHKKFTDFTFTKRAFLTASLCFSSLMAEMVMSSRPMALGLSFMLNALLLLASITSWLLSGRVLSNKSRSS